MKGILLCIFSCYCTISFSQSGNVGINTVSPSAYGHGGTNRLLEIYNPNFSSNSQAHLMLTDSSLGGSLGTVTWASKAISNAEKRVGIVAASFDGSATANSPKSFLRFYTNDGISITENLTINPNGYAGIGITNPQYKLHVGTSNNSFRIEGPSVSATGGAALSIGGFGAVQVDKPALLVVDFLLEKMVMLVSTILILMPPWRLRRC